MRCSCGTALLEGTQVCGRCGAEASSQEHAPPVQRGKVDPGHLIEAIGLFATAGFFGVSGVGCIALTVGQAGSAWPIGLFLLFMAVVFGWYGKLRLRGGRRPNDS